MSPAHLQRLDTAALHAVPSLFWVSLKVGVSVRPAAFCAQAAHIRGCAPVLCLQICTQKARSA